MTSRSNHRRRGRGPWRDVDPEALAVSLDEEITVYAFDEIGASFVANLELPRGARVHHVNGGIAALISALGDAS